MNYDSREYILRSILEIRSKPYFPYKWSEIFKLSYLLNDKKIIKLLDVRIKKLQSWIGLDLYQIETIFYNSDSLDNYFYLNGIKITELEINHYLNLTDTMLIQELVRIRESIKFSSPPPLPY